LPPEAFVATFTGASRCCQWLGAVLDGAAELRTRGRTDILFVFIGDGRKNLLLSERAHREKLNNCLFVDPMPRRLWPVSVPARKRGLMILDNVPAFYYGTSPTSSLIIWRAANRCW